MKHHEKTFKLLTYLRQLKEKNEIQDFKAVSNDSSTLAIWIKGSKKELKDEIYKDYSPFVANILLEEDDEKSELDKDYISLIQELCEEKDFIHNNSHYREWREDFKDLEKSFSELKANTIAGYSFKGGMGRSASLAYLAVYFANQGRKVVVIDFDFEAPGISNLLLDRATQFACFGVLNYLLDKPLLKESVPIDRYGAKAKIENLIVVPSGINSHYKDGVDYFDLLQKINFNSRYYAKTVFDLIEDLQNHYEPDLIFIDTRAGLSESNGTLLRFSKMGLLFFSSEKQSQDGFKLVASRLSDKRKLKDLDRKRFRLINSTIRFDGTPEIRRKKEEFEDFIKKIFGNNFYISHLERNRKMLDASLTDLYDLAEGQEELLPQITDIIETRLLGQKENTLQKIERYNKKSRLAAQNGDYNTAIRHSIDALELVEILSSDEESKRNQAMISSNLGNAYVRLNQFQEAQSYYERALELAKKIKDKELEARTLGNLGNLFFHQKQFKKATDYYELTLNLAKEIRNKELEANSLNNLGIVALKLSNNQEAENHYELALEIAKEIGNKKLEGLSLASLGDVYLELKQFQKAKDYYETALNISRIIGDKYLEGNSLERLGKVHLKQKQYQKAKKYYEQFLEITKIIGDRLSEDRALDKLKFIYENIGKSKEIIEEIDALNDLGSQYLELENHKEAINYYEKSLEIAKATKNQKKEIEILEILGWSCDASYKYKEAKKYYEQVFNIAKETGKKELEGWSLANLGNAYEQLGKLEKAKACFQEAFDILDKIDSNNAKDFKQICKENLDNLNS